MNLSRTSSETAGRRLVRVHALTKNPSTHALPTRNERTGLDFHAGLFENLPSLSVTRLSTPNPSMSHVCGIHVGATEVVIVSVCAQQSQRTHENATKWEFTSDGGRLEPVVSNFINALLDANNTA